MKFLIIGDLHGKIPKLRFKSDFILAPGDFCSDDIRKFIFRAIKLRRKGKRVTWQKLAGKEARASVKKMFFDGRRVLEHLNNDGRTVFAIPGNWEAGMYGYSYSKLLKNLKRLRNCHFRRVRCGNFDIIGYGFVSGPEQANDYKLAFRRLSALFKSSKRPVIFMTHNMPFGVMDKVLNKSSPAFGEHKGSLVSRDIILKYKPLVAVGGHMHEYFGKKKLGKTWVINAGFGASVNALLDIKGKTLKARFYE